MATLIEVRNALKNGDKATARQLLKEVLKEKPSADAWFLAARLSDSRESAIKNLQRALVMDPKHGQARRMLEDLGGEKVSTLKSLTMEIAGGGSAPAARGLLGRLAALPRWQMFVLLGGVLVIMLCLIATLIINAAPSPVEPTWTPRPYALWDVETLASYFRLDPRVRVLETGGPTEGTPVQGRIVIEVTQGSVVQPLRVLFYNSEHEAENDWARLQGLDWDEFVINQNAVLVFPAGVDDDTQRLAVDIFDAAIDPQQVQAAVAGATATSVAATATAAAPTATPAPAEAEATATPTQ